VLPTGDRLTKSREVKQALVVENDDLAVDDCALGADLGTCCGEVAILEVQSRPVKRRVPSSSITIYDTHRI
jgi:hypothetical protein